MTVTPVTGWPCPFAGLPRAGDLLVAFHRRFSPAGHAMTSLIPRDIGRVRLRDGRNARALCAPRFERHPPRASGLLSAPGRKRAQGAPPRPRHPRVRRRLFPVEPEAQVLFQLFRGPGAKGAPSGRCVMTRRAGYRPHPGAAAPQPAAPAESRRRARRTWGDQPVPPPSSAYRPRSGLPLPPLLHACRREPERRISAPCGDPANPACRRVRSCA